MKKKLLFNIVKALLLAIIFWYIGKSITGNLDKIENIEIAGFDPKYMFFSVITLFISLLYPVFAWKFLIFSLGEKINTLSALRVWFISNLGRYVPGKILQFAGLVYFSGREGVNKSRAFQSVLYSQITANGLGIFMGLTLLTLNSGSNKFPNEFHLSLIIAAVFIIILWFPSLFLRSSNYFLERMKKQKFEQTLTRKNYLIYILLQLINWFVMSFSFLLLINSYTTLSVTKHPEVLFILPISWTLGLIAIFAPGGLGVREGSMSYWLSHFIPIEFALILPWIYRIVITLSEMILTFIFVVSYKKPELLKNLKNNEQTKSN
ncbi:TPA: hypothetical protein DCR49_10270 [Candidatus Delongbacteria bacterium]|nr:MAG: hypothetical protein A2Y39_02580 [Candidatus Delongbacteria bacterium GWF2_40_14]HAQ62363.1 hypothetical protein [Candidatus Delongbacteria bacterium]